MKATILVLALILAIVVPAYSQINRHRKMPPGRFQDKVKSDFGAYKFDDKSNVQLFDVPGSRFKNSQFRLWESVQQHPQCYMPCFHPKSGEAMPCVKPVGESPMRVFNPKNVIWGILW